MEYTSAFFEGLDGEASMAFLGLLLGAFLIGLIPPGLTYAFRIRDLRRRLSKHVHAHQEVVRDRNVLEKKLERSEEQLAAFRSRLKSVGSDRAQQLSQLNVVQQELEQARAETLAAQIEASKNEEYLQNLRGKVAALSAQIQSLKQAAQPKSPPTTFDMNAMSSLQTARAKVQALEDRVSQLTADNEKLRRELAK
jgi:chromosome segregation ATPase